MRTSQQCIDDIYRADPNYGRMARGLGSGCPGDYFHNAIGPYRETCGVMCDTTGFESIRNSGPYKKMIDKARRDSGRMTQSVAAFVCNVECWALVAGVWFSGVCRSLSGGVATFESSTGTLLLNADQLAFERPCRWPV